MREEGVDAREARDVDSWWKEVVVSISVGGEDQGME
jgi:hypothetical protein